MQFLFRYANPHNFMRLSGAVLPFTAIAATLSIAAALYLGFSAPPDYQQGRTVLILFIHVPAATMAMSVYGVIAVCSLLSLVWRHPLSDTAARAAAPFGALFTVLLLFLYLGYMALWNAIEDETRAARAAAILALVGAVNIPIIEFSVNWWNTLHQGESIVSGNLAPVFLAPLLLMMLGYMLLFVTLWMVRIRTAILERRARNLMQGAAP
jgi:heme exporter protein C